MRSPRSATWAAAALLTTCLLTSSFAGSAAATQLKTGMAVATGTVPVTHAQNDRVPEGATWTQQYFPSADDSGTELHADVLLPEGLAEGEQVPVILSVGAYFGHSGQNYPEGFAHTGPSGRFADFTEGTDLFDRGYAFVMVDSRGHGGSTGCLDFSGPGQQADVRAAIDWSASQPWSTGAVGMYGKSYDAITGLIGNNLDQDALKAVVAQEPLWDSYSNFYSNGVPRTTVVEIPNVYNASAAASQMPDDDPRYLSNAAYETAHPEGLQQNSIGYRTGDPQSAYWQDRDLANLARGSDTPLFVTQGFLEWNTESQAIEQYLDNHQGPERGWLGQWDHVRGNDRTDDGSLSMGREGWLEETMSFYDQYLKGIEPAVQHPAYAIQDSTGTWRTQDTWPVADASATLPLGGGSYVDDGRAHEADVGNSFITRSEPLVQATRVTGTPRVSLSTEGEGNVMVQLHDVAHDGTAVMFDEQVARLQAGETDVDLRATDWTLAGGHVLAVQMGTITPETDILDPAFGPGRDWISTPSRATVEVTDAQLELAVDNPVDDIATQGGRSAYLDVYLAQRTSDLPGGPVSFTAPPADS